MAIQITIGTVTANGAADGNGTQLRATISGWEMADVRQSWHPRLNAAGAVVGESQLGPQTVVAQGHAIGSTVTGAWQTLEAVRAAAKSAVTTPVTITVSAPSGSQTLSGCRSQSFRAEWLSDRVWRWQWTLVSGDPR